MAPGLCVWPELTRQISTAATSHLHHHLAAEVVVVIPTAVVLLLTRHGRRPDPLGVSLRHRGPDTRVRGGGGEKRTVKVSLDLQTRN